MDTICPKVLVLSHNAFSDTQNNGKTLESFFTDWDKDCLAQIFLQAESPDFAFCHNNYRMTDYEALGNILGHNAVGQKLTTTEQVESTKNLTPSIEKLYNQGKDRHNRIGLNRLIHDGFIKGVPFFQLARNIVWSLAKWKTEELQNWIVAFQPDVLFFQGSSTHFCYQIALWICDTFRIPLILELTDDYTFCMHRFSPIARINQSLYLNSFRQAIHRAHTVFTISSYMSTEYKQRFGGNYVTLLNSVSDGKISLQEPDTIRFLYAGNLQLDRWKVLLSIGQALESIHACTGVDVSLLVCTPAGTPQEIISQLQQIPTITYGGSLNQQELLEQINLSNYLVHVESFDPRMQLITRLSVSTKIPEYLASHRCIYAVGPSNIASIRYLKDNDVAFVTGSCEASIIERDIQNMLVSSAQKQEYIDRAWSLFQQNHQSKDAQKLVNDSILAATGKR